MINISVGELTFIAMLLLLFSFLVIEILDGGDE
jgi:hypothetical protein